METFNPNIQMLDFNNTYKFEWIDKYDWMSKLDFYKKELRKELNKITVWELNENVILIKNIINSIIKKWKPSV
jgi:hypothetical protein